VSSDGGFGQYVSELTTLVKYDMDVTHVLLNDDELGKISKEQRDGGWEIWETDLRRSLSTAIAHDGPALVEIPTDSDPV